MTHPFSKVRSSAIDGRVHNVFYRKTQLKSLFDTLVRNGAAIEQAIARDTGNREAEIKAEVCLAVQSVRDNYDSLDPVRILKDEYKISRGLDNQGNRTPFGIVVIKPTAHTLVYSIVSAVSSSLAAGNCIILQLENTIRQSAALVSRLLAEALDDDIFDISIMPVDGSDIDFPHLYILQDGPDEQKHAHQLVSLPQSRVVAIVERDAELEVAAKALVTARFSLAGRSSYAPDLILVNEWVKDRFLEAIMQQSMHRMAEASGAGRKMDARDPLASFQSHIQSGEARVVISGSNGVILDVLKRDSPLLTMKINSCILVIHSVTSMDDAIDLANSTNSILAAYLFAQPKAGKYLAQFVNSAVCFVNEVPAQLLFGPAAPDGHPCNPACPRYPLDLLTLPKPQLIQSNSISADLSAFLTSPSSKSASGFEEKSKSALQPINRPDKVVRLGFFEQGIQTGAALFLLSIISCTGYIGYSVWKVGGIGWRRR